MKILVAAALALISVSAFAQSRNDYKTRYNRLVGRVGFAGVGVETLLNTWEYADSSDINLILGKFNFYFTKSESEVVLKLSAQKYLGEKPFLALKDSLGRPINYFSVKHYDPELFAKSMRYMDKAVSTAPERLDIADAKANALVLYEAGKPDKGLKYLCSLIDLNRTMAARWKYPGSGQDDNLFTSLIQNYCHRYYTMGSSGTLEAFLKLSEYALKYDKKNTVYMCNVGAYQLAVKKDFKAAKKTFTKVLRLDPDNKVAKQNMEVISRFTSK